MALSLITQVIKNDVWKNGSRISWNEMKKGVSTFLQKDCTNKYTIHHFTQAAPVRTCRYIKVAKTYLALLCHVRNIRSKNTPKSFTQLGWMQIWNGIAPFDSRAKKSAAGWTGLHLHIIWCIKNSTKHSSKTLLRLVWFLMHQTLIH